MHVNTVIMFNCRKCSGNCKTECIRLKLDKRLKGKEQSSGHEIPYMQLVVIQVQQRTTLFAYQGDTLRFIIHFVANDQKN